MYIKKKFERLAHEWRDLWSYWLIPGLAVIFPWFICYRIFRFISRFDWIYQDEVNAMRSGLKKLKLEQDTQLWPRHFRLSWIIEQSDLFLLYFHRHSHLKKHFDCKKVQWPENTPFFTLFYNFGFGFLVLEAMRQNNLKPSLVYKSMPETRPAGMTRMRFSYMKWRVQGMQKACEHQAIGTGGAYQAIQSAIDKKRSVVVVTDAPSTDTNKTIPVALFGQQGRWRAGILKLVQESGLPAVAFRVKINWKTGKRTLLLTPELPTESLEKLSQALQNEFHRGIDEHPELWLYWTAIEIYLPELGSAS